MFDLAGVWEMIRLVDWHVSDLVDFVIVFLIVYELLKLVRGTRAVPMAFGIVVVAMLYQLAHWLELRIVQAILRYALNYSPIAIIVLFQSEIRAALTHIGKTLRNPMSLRERAAPRHDDFDEVVLAATALASRKIGALVVLERHVEVVNLDRRARSRLPGDRQPDHRDDEQREQLELRILEQIPLDSLQHALAE